MCGGGWGRREREKLLFSIVIVMIGWGVRFLFPVFTRGPVLVPGKQSERRHEGPSGVEVAPDGGI